jgi:hypothetical protein
VLESKNPDTGELYTPEDLNVINWNDVGTAMLQDAIWADADKLASDEQYKKNTVNFIAGTIAGCAYARDNADAAAKIVTAAGSPTRREPPAVDDQRGQQADLAGGQWRGHDRRGAVEADGRHRQDHQERDRGDPSSRPTRPPTPTPTTTSRRHSTC